MSNQTKKWECTDCECEFEATLKEDGYLPDCPECGIDYRVYELK